MQTERLNKLTRLHSLYRGCCNIARWCVTRKADRENNYKCARTDGLRAFENSSSRTVTPKERMLRARERKQITSVAPKFEQILLTSPGGWKNDRSFRSEALKKPKPRLGGGQPGRSTIFFHRDGISWNKPDFNVDRNSDRNGRYPPPLPPPQLQLRRNVTRGLSLGHGTLSHVPAEARSARRNSYYWHR